MTYQVDDGVANLLIGTGSVRKGHRGLMSGLAVLGLAAGAQQLQTLHERLLPPLPSYHLTSGGVPRDTKELRDSQVERALRDDATLHVKLTPEHAVREPMLLRACIESGGVMRPLAIPIERYPQGTYLIRAALRDLLPSAQGRQTIHFLIERPFAGPSCAALLHTDPPQQANAGWRWLSLPLRLVPGATPAASR